MDIGKTIRITKVPEPILAPEIKITVPERELVPVRRPAKNGERRL